MEGNIKTNSKSKNTDMGTVKANPLKSERIYVRFVPHENALAGTDKRHPAWGGKADGTTSTFCVPILRSTGAFKNILTNDEKDYLEEAFGLDRGALSVYKKETNYWDGYRVEVPNKEGMYLDLSNPEDYIKYKVLLANSDYVASSVQERIDRPKATYLFEIVREHEETDIENIKMDATMASYREFGKIENDLDTLRVLIELLDGRPYSAKDKPAFFRSRANKLIQADPKTFLSNITDPLLHTKMIIRRATELGKVVVRNDYYYLASDSSPLCNANENSTLSVAAKYLNEPAHQDIKFLLESEVDKHRI